jgi:hypothetical protein
VSDLEFHGALAPSSEKVLKCTVLSQEDPILQPSF